MPDVDPAIIDAIDRVVQRRKADAEWDEDEMRSALLEVGQGESQSAAAESRGFSQPLLSKRWAEVDEEADEIHKQSETESGLFRNPLEEAVDDFRTFFEELNEKYDLGIRDRVIQMMVDEVRDASQLPAPMYLEKFLRGTSSGVQGTDVDYIRSRYESWIQNREGAASDTAFQGGRMGGGGPAGGPQGQQPPSGMSDGIPIGGGGQQQPPFNQSPGGQQAPSRRGGQQPRQQQYQQQPPHQRRPPRREPPQDDEPAKDPRVDELQDQVEQLTVAIGEMAEEDDDDGQQVTIQTEEGVEMTMPFHQAMQAGYIGNDEPDFIEKLQEAKAMGVIPDADDLEDDSRDLMETIQLLKEMGMIGDDEEESMAEAIGQAISELGEKQVQAQQQMSQNFTQVLQQMQQMQETEDEELTAEQVDEIIEERLTKDETERLRDEMDSKFGEMMDEVRKAKSASGTGEQSEEFLKTDRQMEFREKQLETLNENIQVLPRAIAESVREGFVPAMKEMQYMDNGGSNPLFTPPGGDGRGQPEYTPDEVAQTGAQQPSEPRQRQQPQQPAPAPRDEQQPAAPAPEAEADDSQMAQDEPSGMTDAEAQDVRSKLNLGDDDETEEVAA